MTNLLVFRCSCKFCSPSHRADLTPLASPRTTSQTRGLHSLSRTAKRYSRTRTSAYGTNPFLALARLSFLLPRASSRVVPEARTKANILGPSPQRLLLILFSFFIAPAESCDISYSLPFFLSLGVESANALEGSGPNCCASDTNTELPRGVVVYRPHSFFSGFKSHLSRQMSNTASSPRTTI
jgi:hypothetical protein